MTTQKPTVHPGGGGKKWIWALLGVALVGGAAAGVTLGGGSGAGSIPPPPDHPKANSSSSASKRLALFEALPAGVTHRFGLWEIYIGTWKYCRDCSEEAALIVSAIDDDRRVILLPQDIAAFLSVEGEGYFLYPTNDQAYRTDAPATGGPPSSAEALSEGTHEYDGWRLVVDGQTLTIGNDETPTFITVHSDSYEIVFEFEFADDWVVPEDYEPLPGSFIPEGESVSFGDWTLFVGLNEDRGITELTIMSAEDDRSVHLYRYSDGSLDIRIEDVIITHYSYGSVYFSEIFGNPSSSPSPSSELSDGTYEYGTWDLVISGDELTITNPESVYQDSRTLLTRLTTTIEYRTSSGTTIYEAGEPLFPGSFIPEGESVSFGVWTLFVGLNEDRGVTELTIMSAEDDRAVHLYPFSDGYLDIRIEDVIITQYPYGSAYFYEIFGTQSSLPSPSSELSDGTYEYGTWDLVISGDELTITNPESDYQNSRALLTRLTTTIKYQGSSGKSIVYEAGEPLFPPDFLASLDAVRFGGWTLYASTTEELQIVGDDGISALVLYRGQSVFYINARGESGDWALSEGGDSSADSLYSDLRAAIRATETVQMGEGTFSYGPWQLTVEDEELRITNIFDVYETMTTLYRGNFTIDHTGQWSRRLLEGRNRDNVAPGLPIDLGVVDTAEGQWTTERQATLTWNNPADDSGVTRAFYKVGSPPESSIDFTGSASSQEIVITLDADGRHVVYLWLEDGVGNSDYRNWSSAELLYDNAADAPGVARADRWWVVRE